MTYEQVKNLKPGDFKRLCGVRRETLSHMAEAVKTHSPPKQKTGRPIVDDIRILERVPHLLP